MCIHPGISCRSLLRILPRHLKAAAGPSSDPEGYGGDPDMEVISMPATTKVKDSHQISSVFSYVFQSIAILFTSY